MKQKRESGVLWTPLVMRSACSKEAFEVFGITKIVVEYMAGINNITLAR
jgi:hypothetical protein